MSATGSVPTSTFMAGDGSGYERQMGRWSRRLAPLFVDFAGISEGEHVLDVGCGTGSLAFTLSQNPNVRNISAIDYSPIYVEYAKRLNKDPRVQFQVGDACALPFEDATFDHCASLLVLAFIPRADLAVREMRRVTRPGGTVAGSMWDARGGLIMSRIFWDTAAMLDQRAVERRARAYSRPMTRPGDLARAWRDAGFRDTSDAMITIRMDFADFEDFWTPMEGKDGPFAEYVSTLSIEGRSKLRDAVRLAYLDGENDGARSYAATAWVVKGRVPEQ
ncbi:SAM-dependent methyltransferase [Mesorhizobium sp. L-8-10]|uniref:class I SAM-dependent methyltransferase n=1 Tax=Mesorhizobium sp. L-8-10 TaxID=2744523 RepID=UPI001938FCCB|nr:class I SAM-dependent methyltransferase [Mesorhizobium sp. L-8-10]BCH32125.1 SAM-dependent methyltransferase [Mesorhizobium sp. L-8-10]